MHLHIPRASERERSVLPCVDPNYPFIPVEEIATLPSEDIACLRVRKSLSIPDRDLTQEFIDQYFQLIHPTVPILSESSFRGIWSGESCGTLSLFVFQALLFASCPVSYTGQPVYEIWSS